MPVPGVWKLYKQTVMKLSTKSRYGLRVLLQIAMDSEKSKVVSGREISRKQEISEPYLEQIMIPLKNAGIVSTVRGCRGGYRLKRPYMRSRCWM